MNYFTSKLKNKARLVGLYDGLTNDFSRFNSAAKELETEIWLDRAIGAQLDVIGVIVGVGRALPNAMYGVFFGYAGQPNSRGYGMARYRRPFESSKNETYSLEDIEYREVLKWKIHDNQSRGTINDIRKSIRLILGEDAEKVVSGNGVVDIYIKKQENSLFYDTLKDYVSVAPGIRLEIHEVE